MFKKSNGVDLATFVGGIVRALTKGQQALVKSRREQITKHFTEKDGKLIPNVKLFQFGEGQVLPVPTYSLSRVNNIGIDSALIKCSAKIVDIEKHDINCDITDHNQGVKYIVMPSSGKGGDNFEIEIKFSKRMDCEAEEQLIQNLNGLIEVETIK